MTAPLFTGGNHICIATHDLDRAVRTWWDRYGVGPWRVYRFDPSTVSAEVDGRPAEFSMRAALAQVGPHFRVEIIQPLDGDNPYTPSLERHGGADHIHHVRFDVADYDDAVGVMDALGLRSIMDARFAGGTEESPRLVGKYVDTTDDLGFVLELADAPSGFVMASPEYEYPPAAERESDGPA
jgi:Glyoxalase/Bleomycin resistance protein/Dioxygenase superfamily